MSLYSAIVKSFVKNVGNFASGLVGVPIAGDIVVDAWENWQKEADERQRKAELESYARQRMDEAVKEALAVVQREAPGLAPDLRAALVQYLAQVPAAVRRSLRRPADHTGTTVPPGLALRSANDLLPFLPPKLPRFQPGDKPLTNSDLELVELLGQGGFGEVWKARHLDRPKLPPVALKFCLDAAAARSLERERDLLDHVASAGKHDGIVQLLYTHLRANPPCLEYEYVEGGDLTGVFTELHGNGVPSAKQVAKVVLDLAKIVAFAHGQNPAIVHRDLKPANILVRRRDGELAFKIADFGIGGLWAKEALHKLHTGQTKPSERKHDTVLGAYTPLYASPQQMQGDPPEPRDDVHALGIIWFQLQTGRLELMALPSDSRDDLVAAKMPGSLLDLLAACIASRLEKRPTNASDFAKRLHSLLQPKDDPDSGGQKKQETKKPSLVVPTKEREIPVPVVGAVPNPLAAELANAAALESAKVQYVPQFTNSIGMKFVRIPHGTFWMGKRGAQKQVEIPHDFYMGIYPVTQGQWQALMGGNPSCFSRTGRRANKVQAIADTDLKDFPLEQVNSEDAESFIKELNRREKDPGWIYRLPQETEWEYACRGGATSKDECSFDFYLDKATNDLSSDQANFGKNIQRTTKVGSYPPNRLGIFDMHGNVWEWCYKLNATADSTVLARGGCWNISARVCQADRFYEFPPLKRDIDIGFRLARVPTGS